MARRKFEAAQRLAESGREATRRGAFEVALWAYTEALALLDQSPPTTLVVDLERWTGGAHLQLGCPTEAEAWYRRSLATAEEIAYEAGCAHALNGLGALSQRSGSIDKAFELYQEAVLRAGESGEGRLQGMVLHNLGILANIQGDTDSALVRFRMSLMALERIGDDTHVSFVLNDLGKLHTDQKRFAEAEDAFSRGLALARAAENSLVEGVIEMNRAEAFLAVLNFDAAEAASVRALEIARSRTDSLRIAEALRIRAMLARERANLKEAESALAEARTLLAEGPDALLHAEILRDHGEILYRQARLGMARVAWMEALGEFRRLGANPEVVDLEARLNALASSAPVMEETRSARVTKAVP